MSVSIKSEKRYCLGILFDVFSVPMLVIMLPAIWRIVNYFFLKLMLFLLYVKMVYYRQWRLLLAGGGGGVVVAPVGVTNNMTVCYVSVN
jgi:succinate-acetate transporter protein